MNSIKIIVVLAGGLLLTQLAGRQAMAAPQDDIKADARCSVCGMFVAKYPTWITQIIHMDGTLKVFDGVKDMMAYYLNPEKYGGKSRETVKEIWVKDYYSLKWIDAKAAFFVMGSDVNGPMGHELIPFATRAAGESFLKDHNGAGILAFSEITPGMIESMRAGHMMRH